MAGAPPGPGAQDASARGCARALRAEQGGTSACSVVRMARPLERGPRRVSKGWGPGKLWKSESC